MKFGAFIRLFHRLSPQLRLGLYIILLYSAFMTWGLLQEKITTTDYINRTDDSQTMQWNYPTVLNFLMTASACATAAFTESVMDNYGPPSISFFEFWRISLSSALGSPIGYFSLRFITYPMMVLTKSCKPVPVMVMGTVFYRRSYPWYKYLNVTLLCAGVSLFTFFKAGGGKASQQVASSVGSIAFGLFLVLVNLVLDGITSNEQDQLFQKHQPTSLQMMKHTNGWQAIYYAVYLVLDLLWRGRSSDIFNAVLMMYTCNTVIRDIVVFCVCSSFGQLMIFGLIKEFGSLVWIMIAVSRQLFTILLSVFIFGHHISLIQWAGILLVFSGLSLEIGMTHLGGPQKPPSAAAKQTEDEEMDLENMPHSPFTPSKKKVA